MADLASLGWVGELDRALQWVGYTGIKRSCLWNNWTPPHMKQHAAQPWSFLYKKWPKNEVTLKKPIWIRGRGSENYNLCLILSFVLVTYLQCWTFYKCLEGKESIFLGFNVILGYEGAFVTVCKNLWQFWCFVKAKWKIILKKVILKIWALNSFLFGQAPIYFHSERSPLAIEMCRN